MEDMDKTIEIMKAAMEKEKVMKEKREEARDQQIEEEAGQEEQSSEAYDDVFLKDDQDTNPEVEENMKVDNDEVSEEVEASEAGEEKHSKTNKSFFKNFKSKEFSAKDQKIEELTDRLMRTMAEFDNFRKRTEKEKAMMYDMGIKSMIEKILPVVDSFERGLGTVTEEEKGSAFAQGIELIYRQLLTSLDEIGLKPIAAVGKEFDPNLHHAVMHGEDENLGENLVSDEFQKGYLYRDMVVRHSMVKVVN